MTDSRYRIIVAVGMGCEDDTGPCLVHPTVWTSSNGTSWDRSPADPEVFGSGAMAAVEATEHGIVAAGGLYTGEDDDALMQPAVWLSPDGISWERVWAAEAFDVSTASVTTGFQALTVGPDGLIVGVGTATNDQADT